MSVGDRTTSGAASAQDAGGTLTGVITDAAGAPVAGAFVQMRNAERRLNFMVITQEQGKYAIDRLPAGKYVVQAIGGEHQSTSSSPVEVAVGRFRVRLTLQLPDPPPSCCQEKPPLKCITCVEEGAPFRKLNVPDTER